MTLYQYIIKYFNKKSTFRFDKIEFHWWIYKFIGRLFWVLWFYKITEILFFNIDLSKNQKNCSKLVDWYSEEVKANYSELNQKVDIIQENLMDVRPHINILYASVWSSLYVR